MMRSPLPGLTAGVEADPLSETRHSTSAPDTQHSIRMVPPLLSKAWRTALVMSSETIIPSIQQRREDIWNGRSTSRSSILLFSSLEPLIDRQRSRRYAEASMQSLRDGI